MSSAMYERMRGNPKFRQLVATRGRFAWTLSLIVLSIFYGYVMTVAFNPTLLAQPLVAGSAWTIGVASELFMFISFWLLTALYVRRANTEFDALAKDVINDAWKENRQ